ncbi:MAG: hypothetical protein WKG01_31155 [Kofleriaceae bacterium]
MRVLILATLCVGGVASAAPKGDGYCDYVEGAASAESALLFAPEVFGQIGQIEQSTVSMVPGVDPGGLRFIGGLRYSLSGVYEGFATKGRAKADCKRHEALEAVRGLTIYRALDARVQVYDDAMAEAEKTLKQSNADFEARRITAQEATATRLRVEELRRLTAETRQAMTLIPAPSTGGDISNAVTSFQRADEAVETHEAKLRRAKAFDVNVRVGVDTYLDDTGSDQASPYFALLSVGVNLGVLFQGSGNDRAATGRKRLVRSGRDPLSVDATVERLRAMVETATRRQEETAALEADLAKQITALDRVSGDDSKRYRVIVWFDLVKIRAEHAFHTAHVAALQQVLGEAQ